jgi:hypothetical protein
MPHVLPLQGRLCLKIVCEDFNEVRVPFPLVLYPGSPQESHLRGYPEAGHEMHAPGNLPVIQKLAMNSPRKPNMSLMGPLWLP